MDLFLFQAQNNQFIIVRRNFFIYKLTFSLVASGGVDEIKLESFSAVFLVSDTGESLQAFYTREKTTRRKKNTVSEYFGSSCFVIMQFSEAYNDALATLYAVGLSFSERDALQMLISDKNVSRVYFEMH